MDRHLSLMAARRSFTWKLTGWRQILALGLFVAVSASMLMGKLTDEMLEGEVTVVDEYIRSHVHAWSYPALTLSMIALTELGSPIVLGVACVVVIGWLLARGRRLEGWTVAAAVTGSAVLQNVLKYAFHRPRPPTWFYIPMPDSFSYPSGHALSSLCFFAAIMLVFAPDLGRAGRIALQCLCTMLILLVGFSRIYLGVHYPADVAAGYLTGLIWMSTLGVVLNRLRDRRHAAARSTK